MRLAILLLFLAVGCVKAQSSSNAVSSPSAAVTNAPAITDPAPADSFALREQIRMDCINHRKCICGRIVKVLPDALIVESGYTNLLRYPLNQSWLVPGTATASLAPGILESSEPGAVCVGLVCVTDLPKIRRVKPNLYDYVIIQGYPAGDYSYTSVGDIHRTVRRFSASIAAAVNFHARSAIQKQGK